MARTRPCKYCGNPIFAPNAVQCPKCGGKKPWPTTASDVFAGLLIIGLIFVSCFVWIGNSNKSSSLTSNSSGTSSTSRHAFAGDITTLRVPDGGNVPVGIDEKAYDRIVELSVAKDTLGLAQLQLQGLMWTVPSGTRVCVISSGFLSDEVRILSGDHMGQSCIVASEFVSKL